MNKVIPLSVNASDYFLAHRPLSVYKSIRLDFLLNTLVEIEFSLERYLVESVRSQLLKKLCSPVSVSV